MTQVTLASHSADREGNSGEFPATANQRSSASASMSLTVSFSQVLSNRRSVR
jgi:hypothetical protein